MASLPPNQRPLRVVHVISGLGVGGAERVLQRLCREHRRLNLAEPSVISLGELGPIGAELRADGFPVTALELRGRAPGKASALLAEVLTALKPDVVQSWLYHADLLCGLALRRSGLKAPLAWNLRCTVPGATFTTRALLWVNAAASHFLPRSIVCCGESARDYHAARGYDRSRMTVIPNGFEIDRFVPPQRMERSGPRFLAIGRDDPLKDYPTMLRAFAAVAAAIPDATLTIHGRGIAASEAYRALVGELQLADRVTLGGPLDDVRGALAQADIYCSSSSSEGFPNVIGEAMLMELPCAVTDAGDSAPIVGNTGEVAPIRDPQALAEAMLRLARLPFAQRQDRGREARRRIEQNFAMESIARRYADHYSTLIERN